MPLITKMVRHPNNHALNKGIDNYGRTSPPLRSSPDLFSDARVSPGIHERTITFDALTGICDTNTNLHDLENDFLDRSEHGTIRMFSTGTLPHHTLSCFFFMCIPDCMLACLFACLLAFSSLSFSCGHLAM